METSQGGWGSWPKVNYCYLCDQLTPNAWVCVRCVAEGRAKTFFQHGCIELPERLSLTSVPEWVSALRIDPDCKMDEGL